MVVGSGAAIARVFGALALSIAGSAATAADLKPHRALYDLDLAAVHSGSEIAALSGKMLIEWADACDGWTVSQRIQMAVSDRRGPSFENDIAFSSFETKAGDRLRFSIRWMAHGKPFREFAGRAQRGPAGGVVSFAAPAGQSLDLPRGTLFPTEHLFLLVDAAAAGESRLSSIVFGGTGPDSLHEVSAFIGEEIPAGSRQTGPGGEDRQIFRDLAELRSWPVSIAYFPAGSAEPEPDFEVAYRLVENGVAEDLMLDYGEFAMDAVLDELEFISPPEC